MLQQTVRTEQAIMGSCENYWRRPHVHLRRHSSPQPISFGLETECIYKDTVFLIDYSQGEY